MISALQGVVPDIRPPGYMSGPSFGPLGPSRVIFQVLNNTMPYWPAGRYAMPRASQGHPDDDPFQCSWIGGLVGPLEANLTMVATGGDPYAFVFTLRLYTGSIPAWYEWRGSFNDFVWNYAGRTLTPNSSGALQITAFRKVAEWVNLNELSQVPTWLEGDP